MNEVSGYLLQRPKPAPRLVPGEIKIDARGIHRCRFTVWLGHGRTPDGWLYILDEENIIAKILVEDTRLNLKGSLRCLQRLLQAKRSGCGARRKVQRVEEAERDGEARDDRGYADEVQNSHAGGTHRRDLGVGGEAGQSQKDSHQDCHWDRNDQEVRQQISEDF